MISSILNCLAFPGGGEVPEERAGNKDTKFLLVGARERKIAYQVKTTSDCTTNSAAVVIYFHGNAENIFEIKPAMAELSSTLDCTVFCYDYAGYGLSPGKSTESRTYMDALEVYDFVLKEYAGEDPSRIILIGRSLGSAPAIYTATQRSGFSVLVLISALTSAMKTNPSLHFRILDKYDIFHNDRKLPYINQPILFFHGVKDKIVPCSHSKTLFALAKNPKSELHLFEKAGHNNINQAKLFARIRDFISNVHQHQHHLVSATSPWGT